MPNPIRSLPSIGVTLNVEMDNCIPGKSHEMVSIKMGEDCPVKFIERCHHCGWIDEASLQWWVDDAIKLSNSKRAQRIAVAASNSPFRFVQMPGEELTLEEILFQALGAASMCWATPEDAGEFDSARAKEVGMAVLREVNRALDMVRQQTMAEQHADTTVLG